MNIYSFFNSSTSYRVRIVARIKGIDHNIIPVNIRKNEQKEYLKLNPSCGVPFIEDDGFYLGQSAAIISYLEEAYPAPRLIPADLKARAKVLEITNLISCDTHPLNNKRVLVYLRLKMGADDEKIKGWYDHWIAESFTSLEQLLSKAYTGSFCYGDSVTIADCFFVPQVANALRMKCDISRFPLINKIYDHCMSIDHFFLARPECQIDYTEQ